MFLEEVADTNMRIFLGMGRGNDFKLEDHRAPKTKVRANPDNSNMVWPHLELIKYEIAIQFSKLAFAKI